MRFNKNSLFRGNPGRYAGVPPINVYIMRATFLLMATLLAKDVWTYIFTHSGSWDTMEAVAWSVWAAFGTLAIVGVFRTVEMIPLLLLEILYKLIWLALVALPLAQSGAQPDTQTASIIFSFVLVILPIIGVPWPWVLRTYLLGRRQIIAPLDKHSTSTS